MAVETHQDRRNRLATELRQRGSGPVRLAKSTSNLFRDRGSGPRQMLDVSDFHHVLNVDPAEGMVEVEGMTTYAELVDATLAHGLMPAVVPELKSITIGGAVSGVGIESSSFRYGLVHETVSEMDVLLANGEIVTCTADNEHRDLFFGLPNSYGTLGYILKLKALALPVKPYVRLTHIRIPDTDEFFATLQDWCTEEIDFVDGTVFRRNDHYLTVGQFVDEAPYTSDYTHLNMYFRSISARSEDYLTTHDYLWRWDTDWFWCSKNLYVQNPLMRRLLGRKRLNSVTYQKVMRWNGRVGFTRTLSEWFGYHSESVIQDIDIPIQNASNFLDFFHREIGIRPLWICPVGHPSTDNIYPLFPMTADTPYINFGFWDVIRGRKERPTGYYNRKVEEAVTNLRGIKSLYSSSYYPEDEFWSLYGGKDYRKLKQRYDPEMRLNDLYQKSVLRQ